MVTAYNDSRATLSLCRACERAGACRVGMQALVERTAERMTVSVICPADWEGGPNVAHGGWTAAVFDDVMGRFYTGGLLPEGHFVVTKQLQIDFVKPVPIEVELLIHVYPEPVAGRSRPLRAELVLADSGAIVGRAHGTWVERDLRAHFSDFTGWLVEQRSSTDQPT